MRAAILTLFPEPVKAFLNHSILKRAVESELLSVRVLDIRDFSKSRHRQVDDTPYGGGPGMVLSPGPVYDAIESMKSQEGIRLILTSPRGKPFNQEMAKDLSRDAREIVFLCGHYEGLDERIITGLGFEEISIGDYVLTGGELPALVMLDAMVRLAPGALGSNESVQEESFYSGLLEYPHYTKPRSFREMEVPEVLLSGHHEAIRKWRLKEALRKTMHMRPDLMENRVLTPEERSLVREIQEEDGSAIHAGREGKES